MTTNHGDVLSTVPYIAKVFYRDVALPVDPHHATDLRERDREVFDSYGTFCRRVVPGEFPPAYAVAPHAYVVVDFAEGRWQRHLGDRAGSSTAIMPRRRATGRRRA